MYKLSFYVPETHLEKVKNALFAKGAGQLGHYRCCVWQCLGEGQFMPGEGSKPFIGKQQRLVKVPEYKVETICEDQYIQAVVAALKKAHPYEEPSYEVIRMEIF
ncbi:MAG TPA: NGG1p interacting factor NIF3 [Gammaproteobacteria bacterium]|nr:NGG1p interacting factor NIF3 [Gammaproteobacteria bacterium]